MGMITEFVKLFYFGDTKMLVTIFIWMLALVVYFIPTICAAVERKKNTAAIFVLNFFLGWTGIGWIAALIWSACRD